MTDTATKPRVLVCEDEMFIAMMLEDRLEIAGYRVFMAARMTQGVELATSEAIDVAMLDINLAGEDSYPVARKLRERGIPFLFSTGYGDQNLPPEWRDSKMLQKPYDTAQIISALGELLGR